MLYGKETFIIAVTVLRDSFLLNRYCIPMDQYHRTVLSAEEKFFDECDTGNGKICFTMLYISMTIKLQSLLWLCSQSVMHYGPQVLQNSDQMIENYLQKSSS